MRKKLGIVGSGFTVLILVFVLISGFSFTPTAEGQASLGIDEVFIRNDNSFALNNDLASVAISFQEGDYIADDLLNVRLKDKLTSTELVTQVTPTSYYKTDDGSGNLYVKTAIARVLVYLNPGEERIYKIVESTSQQPSFDFHPDVWDAYSSGNMLRAVSKDLVGLDGIVGGGDGVEYDTVFNLEEAEVVESGPVVKVWEFTENHRPTVSCNSNKGPNQNCLPFLFSSKFIVTAVSGKPYLKIDHLVNNFGNLKEDSWTSGWPYDYEEGQTGFVFYDSTWFETETGSVPSYLFILDEDFLFPSSKHKDSNYKNTFTIMPTNGQELLHLSPYNEDPWWLGNQNNFFGAGQTLMTRAVLHFGSSVKPQLEDPFDENNIESGQSLARFNQISGYFFEDLTRPDAIDPGFDWTSDAQDQYNDFVSNARWFDQNDADHRWGSYGHAKDAGQTGWRELIRQEPVAMIHYLLSCHDRCEADYLRAMRYIMYGAAHMTDYAFGLEPEEHTDANTHAYRGTLFEGYGEEIIFCGSEYDANDRLGFCEHDLNADMKYKTDALGRDYVDYAGSNYSRTLWHHWTTRDADHMSLGYEFARWMFMGDHMARVLITSKSDLVVTYHHYYLDRGGGMSVRAMGRGLVNTAKTFSVTGDETYRTGTNEIIQFIDNSRNKEDPVTEHPLTGEMMPVVKYFRWGPDYVAWKDPDSCTIQPFEQDQVLRGLGVAYFEAVTDPVTLNKLKNIVTDGLFYYFNYATKTSDNVVNGVELPTGDGTLVHVYEGTGGIAVYNNLRVGPADPDSQYNECWTIDKPYYIDKWTSYNQYSHNFDNQMYQGGCNALKVAVAEDLPNNDEYLNRYKNLFYKVFVKTAECMGSDCHGYANRAQYLGPGIELWRFNDNEVCGLGFALDYPTALDDNKYQGVDCVDNDNDGFTNCIGDCNDNNGNINPGVMESQGWMCSDGVDNNCNGLVDCDDIQCVNFNNCNDEQYCGDGALQGEEQCDVDPIWEYDGGVNDCENYYCVSPFVSETEGCVCVTDIALNLNTLIPNTIGIGEPVTINLEGSGFQEGVKVYIGTDPTILKSGSDVTFISSTLLQISLTAAETESLGEGGHGTRVKNPDEEVSNWLTFTVTETDPPVIYGFMPDRDKVFGETVENITIGVFTDENATCRYSFESGVPYDDMTNDLWTWVNNKTKHTWRFYELDDGAEYTYYVKCEDLFGNENTEDFMLNFSIEAIVLTSYYYDGLTNIHTFDPESIPTNQGLLEKFGFGVINFRAPIEFHRSMYFDGPTNISFNNITVYPPLIPEVNVPSRLYFANMEFEIPIPMVDGVVCEEPQCTPGTYYLDQGVYGNVFMFDVIGFSTYSVGETECVDEDEDEYSITDSYVCGAPDLDCDDTDPDVNPGADEVCGDEIDNNCDGSTDEGCGGCTTGDTVDCGTDVGECEFGTQTCVDGIWSECTGGTGPGDEVCGDDIDQDCDGEDEPCIDACVDNDMDEYNETSILCPESDDCDDTDPDVNPGADEVCGDEIDNNCDGYIDEDCPYCGDDTCDSDEDCESCESDCGPCGPVCGDGTCDSDEDVDSCPEDCHPGPSCGDGTCDSDEDCESCENDCGPCGPVCGDGTCDSDEDADTCPADCQEPPPPDCEEDETKPCGSNIGICEEGIRNCVNEEWGDCVGGKSPYPEDICSNGLDDDCDTEVDEGCKDAEDACKNGVRDKSEEGIDCGGKCTPCGFSGDRIWEVMVFTIIILAVIIGIVIIINSRRI